MSSLLAVAVIAFRGVTVIEPDAGRAVADQTVVIERETIRAVGPVATTAIPEGARVIEGRGRFLAPGLVDLHVHLFSPDDLVAYLSHGVTTVLNMHGEPWHLRLRQEVSEGRRPGPRILSAGPTMDGLPPLNPTFLTIETPAQARAAVAAQRSRGYDFLKVYGTLRPDVFAAIVAEARRQRVPVAGHLNRQVGALEVLRSGQALAAHAQDMLDARFGEPPSDAELAAFADAVAASGMTVTANMTVQANVIAQLEDLAALLRGPQSRLLSAPAYSQWLPANNRNPAGEHAREQIAGLHSEQERLRVFVRLLETRGVRLVTGTDSPPYAFPGISAHEELAEMVRAGLTPAAALRSATTSAGAFLAANLRLGARVGTVAIGASADLLLLSANPLESVDALGAIEGVVARGRYLSRAEVDLLAAGQLATNLAARSRVEEIDALLEGRHVQQAAGRLDEATRSMPVPPIAEWVLWAKHDKLGPQAREDAVAIAEIAARLYPESFSAHYELARRQFAAGRVAAARTQLARSLQLEPGNAAARHLEEKLSFYRQPPTFRWGSCALTAPSGEEFEVVTRAGPPASAHVTGPHVDATASETTLAADRLWISVPSDFGLVELRLVGSPGEAVHGYFAAPFGRNGTLKGACAH